MGKLIAAGVALVLVLFAIPNLIENVGPGENVIIQSVWGTRTCYTTPGPKPQMFGKVYSLPKRVSLEFHKPAAADEADRRIKVGFNDAGKGFIDGQMQFEYPSDCSALIALVDKFGDHDGVARGLLAPTLIESVYFSGPLMSSKESYAEKKNDFAEYVQDQVENGIYRTNQVQLETVDALTGEKKTTTGLQIVMKDGQRVHREKSQLAAWGIKPFNLSIVDIDYDETVDRQIAEQQKITMAVQTSKAEALQAEQKAITVEQQGRAEAAAAKWAQEKEKAREIVIAEQHRDVEKLNVETAKAYKEAVLLRAEADAEAARKKIQADGALDKKLQAWLTAQQYWADAVKGYQGSWTPSIVQGGGQPGGLSGAQNLMDLLSAKTARDLALDLKVKEQ